MKKKCKTRTFQQPQDEDEDKPILFDDSLSSLLQVDSTGKFRWHTNPSTRPIVAKDRGDRNGGKPAEPQQQTGSTAGSSSEPGGDGAVPGGDANAPTTLNYNDHPFTIPATGDNRSANVRVRWATPASDWDVRLYEDLNGDGKSGAGDKEVAVSEQGTTSEEEVGITGNPKLVANKKYVLRVTNFAATEPYEVDITFNGPEPFQPAQVEAYTLTCEVGGKVLQTTQVRVDRGQTTTPDLSECRGRAAAAAATTQAPDATPVPAGAPGAECIPANGFRSTRARGQGRKVAFRFTRAQPRPVTVDVFQQSVGRRVIGERLVARYRNRSRSFTWNGKANRRGRTVTDGFYFVRYRMDLGSRNVDVRRVTLRRSNGRFAVRRSFYRRSGCGLLRSYKLTRPVFGGPNNRELAASFRLARNARVTLEVLRGKRVVRRYATQTRRANITHRLRFDAEDRPRGDFKFRLTVRSGAQTVRSTLVSRRL